MDHAYTMSDTVSQTAADTFSIGWLIGAVAAVIIIFNGIALSLI
jgi:hypothetical protein